MHKKQFPEIIVVERPPSALPVKEFRCVRVTCTLGNPLLNVFMVSILSD
nr:MAG TPA: hypothetical protein [Bacteriophage sp.]